MIAAALMSFTANAALIQVDFTVFYDQIAPPSFAHVVLLFDTSLPPTPGPDNTLVFTPIGAFVGNLSSTGTSSSPLLFLDLNNLPQIEFARLQYFPNGNTIALSALDGTNRGDLSITNMPSAFHSGMSSLPDNPSDWLPDPATTEYSGGTDSPTGLVFWTSGSGFIWGTITYIPIQLPSPSSACSPADINGDGVLNFFDVSAFIKMFQLGCP